MPSSGLYGHMYMGIYKYVSTLHTYIHCIHTNKNQKEMGIRVSNCLRLLKFLLMCGWMSQVLKIADRRNTA